MTNAPIERRHREQAVQLLPSPLMVSAWIDDPTHTYGLTTRELSMLVKASQLLANTEAAALASLRAEQTEAAWAVAVLNAWASAAGSSYSVTPSLRLVVLRPLPRTDDTWREFDGLTIEAACIAAARALYAADPTLPPPPSEEKSR